MLDVILALQQQQQVHLTPLEAILSALTAIGGSGILTWWLARKKVDSEIKKTSAEADSESAEAAETITRAAQSLVEPLQRQISALQAEMARQAQTDAAKIQGLQSEVAELRERVAVLETERDELRRDRDEWHDRFLDAQAECERLLLRLQSVQQRNQGRRGEGRHEGT